MVSVQVSKAALRNEIKDKLLKLSVDQKQKQSETVTGKLFQSKAFQSSNRISVYLSTDNEIDTEAILKRIFETGKACFVPRYDGNVMEMVRLQSMCDWEKLPLTKWNIKQPSIKEKRENALDNGGLDMVIMPGVAFTSTGKRLGHGKGYYDSFLTKLFQKQEIRPVTVAVAFKEQVLDDIPIHDHDVIVDHVFYAN